jgi:hypothetical protein
MRKLISAGVAGLLAAGFVPAHAAQRLLAIQPATSTLRVQMKVKPVLGSSTSSDTVPVSGYLLLDVVTNSTPPRVSVRNFDIHALQEFEFVNSLFLVGNLTTTLAGVQVFDAFPGPFEPHLPANGGSFSTTNLSFFLKGSASYSGPASGVFVLDSTTPQALSNLTGSVQSADGYHTTHATFSFFFAPLTIPSDLGNVIVTISGSGILDAQVPVDEPPPAPPTLSGEIPAENRQYVLRWPSSLWPTPVATNVPAGYWLYRTTNLTDAASWEPEPTRLRDDGAASVVEAPRDAPRRFYRLEWR